MKYELLIDQAIAPLTNEDFAYGKSLYVATDEPTLTKPLDEVHDWTELMELSPYTPPNQWSPRRALAHFALKQIAWDPVKDYENHGFVRGREVAIRPDTYSPMGTLTHELGHFALGHSWEGSIHKTRALREVTSEIVSFCVMAMCGAVTHNSIAVSRFYLASWVRKVNEQEPLTKAHLRQVDEAIDEVWEAGRA